MLSFGASKPRVKGAQAPMAPLDPQLAFVYLKFCV